MRNFTKLLFSPITMLVLLIGAGVAMAVATFIENDFGSQAAINTVYNSVWFEIIFFLLAINTLGNIFTRKLYKKKKLSIFLFHLAFIVMLLGAGITRYLSYEGSMHIRENNQSNKIQTGDKYISVKVFENTNLLIEKDYKKTFNPEKKNKFKTNFTIDNKNIEISLKEFMPKAIPQLVEDHNGNPIIKMVIANRINRRNLVLNQDDIVNFDNTTLAFSKDTKADINFFFQDDSLMMESNTPIASSSMMDENNQKIHSGVTVELKKLYQTAKLNLVIQEIHRKAKVEAQAVFMENNMSSQPAYIFEVKMANENKEITIWDESGDLPNNKSCSLGGNEISISYGNRIITLPFSIHLDDFQIDRYPGSRSPSSYSSYVKLIDTKENTETPFHIYMNNILKYKGFRFYQTSYDKDEKGTILSVNSDSWGTTISYIGYFLMFLGIIVSLLNKNAHFYNISKRASEVAIIGLFALFLTNFSYATSNETVSSNIISKKHADKFGQLLVQDSKGRTKPIYTLASDLVRKISRKEKIKNLSPAQLFLEMTINYDYWKDIPMIKVSNKVLQNQMGLATKYASLTDFVVDRKTYRLKQFVEQAYIKSPGQRSKFDKEVIKVDERVNICYSIFSGKFLNIFPIQGTEHNTWKTPADAFQFASNPEDSIFLVNIGSMYISAIIDAKVTGNYAKADEYLDAIMTYQNKYAGYDLPSQSKRKLEQVYYKFNVFKKLFPFYALLGLSFLILLIYNIISGKKTHSGIKLVIFIHAFVAFVMHTLWLILRWYISGHAPMSNGYESMIFISWVTMLAGFIFNKRTPFALSATLILASLTLMVANLSFMDPEITNLVPVLKSYWLTIHVSVITASYGFLGFGAILGLINIFLFSFKTQKNSERIVSTVDELTVINKKTLILGIYFLTIGTFLGAIWANESWGRYWGWDPKETWSLITIIVYTIVTHSRLIPGMKGIFTFNILSLYGFSSVLMTFFGVNYYLSGLHSYAGGDPVPVPSFVYYSIFTLLVITIFALFNNKNLLRTMPEHNKD